MTGGVESIICIMDYLDNARICAVQDGDGVDGLQRIVNVEDASTSERMEVITKWRSLEQCH